MPKSTISPLIIVSTILESLLSTAHSIIQKDSENPSTNTSVVIEHLYLGISNFGSIFTSHALDWKMLLFLTKYRYPHVEGDIRSSRLCFNFTLTKEQFGSPKDLASFALHFKHRQTLHSLLQEELLTWENEVQLMNGLARSLEPNGFNWLEKSMLLASLAHDYFKDSPFNTLELKEFLQNLMQICSELLNKYVKTERIVILKNMATRFINMFRHEETSLLSFVCPILLLKDLLEKTEYRALIATLSPDKETEIEKIATTYSLDTHSLILRKQQLIQMEKALDEEKSDADLEYLKTRFRLSFIMADAILFKKCIKNASIIRLEALIESIYDVHNKSTYCNLEYFIATLPPAIRKKTLDYLFLKHSEQYSSIYMASSDPEQQKILHTMMNRMLFSAISTLGTDQDEYLYLQRLIQAAITNKSSNILKTLVTFLKTMDSPLSNITIASDLIEEDKGKTSIPTLMIKYPLLIDTYTGKHNEFHKNIIKSIETAEANHLNEKNIWIVYLSLMHIVLILEILPTNLDFLINIRLYCQVLEYWFDQLLANKSKYSSLWTRIQSYLFKTNFFTSAKLKYLFAYRFGESAEAGLAIEKSRYEIDLGATGRALTKAHRINLHTSLQSSETIPLYKDLSVIFQSNKGLIDQQIDFIRSWILWAESEETILKIKPDKYKTTKSSRLILDALINQTPLGEELLKLSGKPGSPSLFLDELKSPINTFEEITKTLLFDAFSSEMFFVLLLFLHRSNKKLMHKLIIPLLAWINYLCEVNPLMRLRYDPFYEVMSKNNFFKHELDNFLIKIFYLENIFYISIAEEHDQAITLDTQETASLPKKHKKKKKKQSTDLSGLKEPVPEEAPQEPSIMPSMLIPIIEAKDVQPPSVGQKLIPPDILLGEDTLFDSSTDGGGLDEAEESEETIAKKTALRKTQQQLYLIFKNLIIWGHAKIAHLGAESIQAIQYNALINVLEANQILLRKIRTLVKKFAVDPCLPKEPQTLPSSVFEYLENYGAVVHKMKELCTDIKGSEQIASLLQDIVIISPDDLMQLQLLEQFMLPEMPIVTKIAALFSKYAKIFISGSSLFLSNPMDIDFCLEMNSDVLSIEEARALFESIIMRAISDEGLDFVITFNKLFIGIASITIKSKGDGYGLHNHKSMDFTLQLSDPSTRLPQLDYTSHSAAKINLITGKIVCTPETARAILGGIFSIHPADLIDPIERYKMDVHVLTTVMRAWVESQLRPLRLDESVISLMKKIRQYKEDQARLLREDADLYNALMGMIIRHFKHFEYNNTYAYRTSMLIAFLTELGMHQLISSGAMDALKSIVSNELEQVQYALSPFIKTEAYFKFCSTNSLLQFSPKDSLIHILSKHFNHNREQANFLQQTQALLNLCKKFGFHVLIQDKVDGTLVDYQLLTVNLIESFMVFSSPLLSSDHPSLLIINAPRLLDSNKLAILTAGMNQKVSLSSPQAMMSSMIMPLPRDTRLSASISACFGTGFFTQAPLISGASIEDACDSKENLKK